MGSYCLQTHRRGDHIVYRLIDAALRKYFQFFFKIEIIPPKGTLTHHSCSKLGIYRAVVPPAVPSRCASRGRVPTPAAPAAARCTRWRGAACRSC